jgi:hypothetical protein
MNGLGVAVAPIISVAGEHARLPALKQHLAAILSCLIS